LLVSGAAQILGEASFMRRNPKKKWLLRGAGAAVLALIFGYGPYHIYNRSGLSRYLELSQELGMIRRENAKVALEIGRLQREAAALRFDDRSIERETRIHTKWVKPGEVVFDLQPAEALESEPAGGTP
jgi:cell division protein FtsB